MDNIPKNFTAQAFSKWVSPQHRLSPVEVRVERAYCRLLESINAAPLHPLASALAAVLAIPPASPPGRGGGS